MNPQISQKYNIHELVLDLELINTVNFIFLCVYVIKVVAGLFFCHICTVFEARSIHFRLVYVLMEKEYVSKLFCKDKWYNVHVDSICKH
jgi:hypothetical protein